MISEEQGLRIAATRKSLEPAVLVVEIVENLESALEQFRSVCEYLGDSSEIQ